MVLQDDAEILSTRGNLAGSEIEQKLSAAEERRLAVEQERKAKLGEHFAKLESAKASYFLRLSLVFHFVEKADPVKYKVALVPN